MKHLLSALFALALLLTAGRASSSSTEAPMVGDLTLTRFYYSIQGSMMPRSWEITYLEDGYRIRENDGTARPFPEALAAELTQVIADNGADSWQGVYETEYEVLDGEGFSLTLDFANGKRVQASGENAFPDLYFSFQRAVLDIFQRDKMAFLAGTYQYKDEGTGSDFILTLNADGSYILHEGASSGDAGTGTWDVYDNAVYLNEGEGSSDRSLMFGVEENTLIYLAAGSDSSGDFKLQDGACFIKQT